GRDIRAAFGTPYSPRKVLRVRTTPSAFGVHPSGGGNVHAVPTREGLTISVRSAPFTHLRCNLSSSRFLSLGGECARRADKRRACYLASQRAFYPPALQSLIE